MSVSQGMAAYRCCPTAFSARNQLNLTLFGASAVLNPNTAFGSATSRYNSCGPVRCTAVCATPVFKTWKSLRLTLLPAFGKNTYQLCLQDYRSPRSAEQRAAHITSIRQLAFRANKKGRLALAQKWAQKEGMCSSVGFSRLGPRHHAAHRTSAGQSGAGRQPHTKDPLSVHERTKHSGLCAVRDT